VHGQVRQEGEREGRARDARAQAWQLKSGGSGRTVKSRKQAIAIGLSEARKAGAKVPKKKGARKSTKKR
jgi:hypothetical protein